MEDVPMKWRVQVGFTVDLYPDEVTIRERRRVKQKEREKKRSCDCGSISILSEWKIYSILNPCDGVEGYTYNTKSHIMYSFK
jgi:hypothetical protein